MNMNQTPVSNRLHLGIFGRRNAGKSSFINAFTGQDLAIVSDVPGTTTDPVYKTIEILPEPGPCVIIDTAGLDDEGHLGEKRREKALAVLTKTDLALVIIDPAFGIAGFEQELLSLMNERKIPVVLVVNKLDVYPQYQLSQKDYPVYYVSSVNGQNIIELRAAIPLHVPSKIEDLSVVKGIVKKGDTVILVIPIDSAMPKGRLILPEVQVLRAVLDENASAFVCKEVELVETLEKLKSPPDLVITDSQVYHLVKDMVPESIKLTSFSMLFARYKGDFKKMIAGAAAIDDLKPGDKVLIAEACTHHPQPQDIARFKIPNLLNAKAGGALVFDQYAGPDYPADLSGYKLIVMCGSCMINQASVMHRIREGEKNNIPVTNYGVLFAKMHGILDRTAWLADV